MKIQCDVCSAEEASVFCCADEAALCDACDGRVHRANKLAGKHRRFSVLKPSSSPATPLCDVCQERRGILFCQEDRAILCRDCDVPIHNANHHTMKHSRFLLTGVRLSSAPIPSSSEAEAEVVPNISNNNHHNQNCDSKINKDQKVVALEEEEVVCTTSSSTTTTTNTNTNNSSSSSSISEYLIKMLPGWHVEDFLFDDATTNSAIHNGSFQGDELLPFMESSSTRSGLSAAAAKGLPIWVPTPGCLDHGLVSKEASHQNHCGGKDSRQRWGEDFLMVPQFHHDFNSNKRPRTSL